MSVDVNRKVLRVIEDFNAFDFANLEGMTFGPRLPNGHQALLLVSDNNFTPGQVSQFLLLEAR